ncbi:MAG TPA: peptidase U32 family protein, partial [Pyrinomonadaceae bacterium]|nr:peptidase U32 family protein [Pyrinomonadaceae bacterium]
AVNAEFHTSQSNKMAKAVEAFSDCGVDALIVGDFGLLHFLKKSGNRIPIHASTLLGIYNAQGIRLLHREYGVNRVVLNTNLYIDEIAEIHRLCPEIELEMIAHGGICFNDNRRCRQPHYLFEGEYCVGCKQLYESFPDSPKLVQLQPLSKVASQVRTPEIPVGGDRLIWSPEIDLSSIVGLFMRVGVVSFKIEGRTRGTAYIEQSTRKFREAIDNALAEEVCLDDELSKYFYLAHHAELRSRI